MLTFVYLDVYCGDEEKIVEMLLDLRAWVEEKYKIDDPLLRSKMFI
jgi:hypothetical protein